MAFVKVVVADTRDDLFIPRSLTVELDSGFRMGKLFEEYKKDLYHMALTVFDIDNDFDAVYGFYISDDTVDFSEVDNTGKYDDFLVLLKERYLLRQKVFGRCCILP